MRPSTLLELAGFGLVTYAVYEWRQLVGLAVGGVFLLLIGYATEDEAAVLTLGRPFRAVGGRIARAKAKRRQKKG